VAVNARDEQVIRQTILQADPNARDLQVMRQSIIRTTANARDLQVFRQTICLLGASSSLYTLCYAAT
jgi:hypothetical protein